MPVSKALSLELEKFASTIVLTSANLDRALLESAKGGHMRPQADVNFFAHLHELAGIPGASSHSGRRRAHIERQILHVQLTLLEPIGRVGVAQGIDRALVAIAAVEQSVLAASVGNALEDVVKGL